VTTPDIGAYRLDLMRRAIQVTGRFLHEFARIGEGS